MERGRCDESIARIKDRWRKRQDRKNTSRERRMKKTWKITPEGRIERG